MNISGQYSFSENRVEVKCRPCEYSSLITAYFIDGYSETRKFEASTDVLNGFDDLRARHGELVDFTIDYREESGGLSL